MLAARLAVLSAHHQGSYGCLRITAKTREWDGGSATTERRVPRRSLLGAVGCGSALPARGEVPGSLNPCSSAMSTWAASPAAEHGPTEPLSGKTLSAVADTAAVRGGALSWRQEYEDIRRPPSANRSEGRL